MQAGSNAIAPCARRAPKIRRHGLLVACQLQSWPLKNVAERQIRSQPWPHTKGKNMAALGCPAGPRCACATRMPGVPNRFQKSFLQGCPSCRPGFIVFLLQQKTARRHKERYEPRFAPPGFLLNMTAHLSQYAPPLLQNHRHPWEQQQAVLGGRQRRRYPSAWSNIARRKVVGRRGYLALTSKQPKVSFKGCGAGGRRQD